MSPCTIVSAIMASLIGTLPRRACICAPAISALTFTLVTRCSCDALSAHVEVSTVSCTQHKCLHKLQVHPVVAMNTQLSSKIPWQQGTRSGVEQVQWQVHGVFHMMLPCLNGPNHSHASSGSQLLGAQIP
ncbi:hypothetical protein Pelo_6347 [Pelomyxa schiedti]|nr:hypothetical protein Pelo_6347 [Pelomyxa schiedti]